MVCERCWAKITFGWNERSDQVSVEILENAIWQLCLTVVPRNPSKLRLSKESFFPPPFFLCPFPVLHQPRFFSASALDAQPGGNPDVDGASWTDSRRRWDGGRNCPQEKERREGKEDSLLGWLSREKFSLIQFDATFVGFFFLPADGSSEIKCWPKVQDLIFFGLGLGLSFRSGLLTRV